MIRGGCSRFSLTVRPIVKTPNNVSDEYAQLQRQYYDSRIVTEQDAKTLVGCYNEGANTMPSIAQFVLDEYRQRQYKKPQRALNLLDFGCGVGRIMEAFKHLGIQCVDGVDISQKMLTFAGQNPALKDSRFYLTSGSDCGAAPQGHYDLVTSLFCLQHICHHDNRMSILRSMRECLSDEGMVAIEMQFFPTCSSDNIPGNHAAWSENKVSSVTNSEADVWITFDKLGECVRDISECFADLAFYFVDIYDLDAYEREHSAATINYQYPFQHVYFFGGKHRRVAKEVCNKQWRRPRLLDRLKRACCQ